MTENAVPLPLFAGYGIEIEYMIVDQGHLSILPATDRVMKAVAGEFVNDIEVGPIAWSNELVLHLIELKTNGPVTTLDALPEQFLANIRHVNDILGAMNGRLMPTAMHPWMDPELETRLWPHEANEIYDTFNRIFDCQGHGWSNLQSMHLNLPFADDGEFALLHSAIRVLLPVMPAIAASSPIMNGVFTGLMDNRLEAYRHNADRIPAITSLVIPEHVTGRQDYRDRILQPMFEAIAPYDPEGILQHEWLNARGAIARFERNTIEIRILDTQETPAADLAIASIIISVLKTLVAGTWSDLNRQAETGTEKLAGIFSDAIRDAERTVIADRDYLALFDFPDRRCEARELWQYFVESVSAEESEKIPARDEILRFILNHGPLARRIIEAVGEGVRSPRLDACYRELCDCLAEGRLFEGID